MSFTSKVSSPVLFDAVILIFSCKNDIIEEWLDYFKKPLVHEEVYKELVDSKTKRTIEKLIREDRITIVEEPFYEDLDAIQQALYDSCADELKDRFDIRNENDLGEYKTLLYSKLYEVPIISTQDTTVWELYISSKNFKGSQFITIQDISYMMYKNGNTKLSRAIYKSTTDLTKYPRNDFLEFASFANQTQEYCPCFLEFKSTID